MQQHLMIKWVLDDSDIRSAYLPTLLVYRYLLHYFCENINNAGLAKSATLLHGGAR